MLSVFKKLFSKNNEHVVVELPESENATFELKVDDIIIGTLHCDHGVWEFKYTDAFKQHSDEYNKIIGFSDLNKTYRNAILWPFFQTRIPGLKQPAVQEILAREKISQTNEVELLKRFGKRTISNPYELELV